MGRMVELFYTMGGTKPMAVFVECFTVSLSFLPHFPLPVVEIDQGIRGRKEREKNESEALSSGEQGTIS